MHVGQVIPAKPDLVCNNKNMTIYRCGIENEYLLINTDGSIRDFTNLNYSDIKDIMINRPGENDTQLNKGDLGIKSGYWYLEGDERFDEQGSFTDMKVKGIEIRTPIKESIDDAVMSITTLEKELKGRLSNLDMDIASVGFNPVTTQYTFDPPLNQWEVSMRKEHPEYDYANISNLTFGPDINFSFPDFTLDQIVDIAKKLTYYSPFIVPFSFSSPFFDSKLWSGLSRRTYERTWRRPAVKVFVSDSSTPASPLLYQSKNPYEVGRIEFKAFDAFISKDIMTACCYLVLGVCLDTELDGRADTPDKELHQRSATDCWNDKNTKIMSSSVLSHADSALAKANISQGAEKLAILQSMLDSNLTPSSQLIESFQQGGKMYSPVT